VTKGATFSISLCIGTTIDKEWSGNVEVVDIEVEGFM